MPTDYRCLNIVGRAVESQRQIRFKAGRIERAPQPDDAVFGQARRFQRQIGHRIHRVGNNHENGIGRVLQNVFGNAFYDAGIDADQVFAGHAGLTRQARCDYNDIRTRRFFVIISRARQFNVAVEQCRCLKHIERFPFADPFLDIQQHDFMRQFTPGNIIGAGGPNGACSYYGNFHTVFGIKGLTCTGKNTPPIRDKPTACGRNFGAPGSVYRSTPSFFCYGCVAVRAGNRRDFWLNLYPPAGSNR